MLAAPQSLWILPNYDAGMCNWMVPADDEVGFCAACRHNRVVPDLSVPGNDVLWRKIETAKHRLFYSLLRLGLPLENRSDDPEHGLAVDFLADPPETHASEVMTGHDNGLITINLAEADDAERERRRSTLGEPYRTLLGHMRHEVGHYYWDRLVADAGRLDAFRALFGDERQDYAEALQARYAKPPSNDWQDISSACMQPPIPGKISPKPGRITCISWTRWRLQALLTEGEAWRANGALAAAIDFDPYRLPAWTG